VISVIYSRPQSPGICAWFGRHIPDGLGPHAIALTHVFNVQPPCSVLLTTLWCYGCNSELPAMPEPHPSSPAEFVDSSPTPAETSPSPERPVPRPHYRESKCREDKRLTEGVRHHRESRDLQGWSNRNSRESMYSFPIAAFRSYH
jgi:hypothetical protein